MLRSSIAIAGFLLIAIRALAASAQAQSPASAPSTQASMESPRQFAPADLQWTRIQHVTSAETLPVSPQRMPIVDLRAVTTGRYSRAEFPPPLPPPPPYGSPSTAAPPAPGSWSEVRDAINRGDVKKTKEWVSRVRNKDAIGQREALGPALLR